MIRKPAARRRLPVGRVSALLAIVAGALVVLRGGTPTHWRALAPGVEFGTMRGEPFCRRGSAEIGLLRLDPARARLEVRHYSQEPERTPLDIVEWQRRTRALAVFNAGQYYPDYSYMGLLVCGGERVSPRSHPQFGAALVAGPEGGGRTARVLDLEREPLDPAALRWRHVAQSFMLFDEGGQPRVRRSDRVANRTVVAEDRRGRLVVAASEGGYTLWEFAGLLQHAPLNLSHAMSMDGGEEAELLVRTERFGYANYARWDGGREIAPPEGIVPLPAVVCVKTP